MRAFGTVIRGNRGKNTELSESTRSAILTAIESGISSKVADFFSVSRSTIYNTIKRFQQRQDFKSNFRSGRPQKLTSQAIYRLVRRSPRLSWKALVASTPYGVSKTTIRRVLRKYNLRKWKSKKRIPLNKVDTKKRYEFTKLWRHFTDWNSVIFSDECSVQRKSNSHNEYVFRFDFEAFREDLVNLTCHGKDISQMVWGSIWIGGRSKLVIMERDEIAPRQGYSANSYIKSLEEGLMPIYEPGQIFQQDSASIHKAQVVRDWFEIHGIWIMD